MQRIHQGKNGPRVPKMPQGFRSSTAHIRIDIIIQGRNQGGDCL